MLFYQKKYLESVDAFKMAVKLREDYYLHWGNLADALKLNNNSESVDSYKKAVNLALINLKTNPNDSTSKAALAYYFACLGEEVKSIKYAKQIDSNNNGYDNFFIATAYNQLNNIDMTLFHLEIALSKNYPLDEIRNTPLLKNVKNNKKFIEMTEIKSE